MMKNKQQTLIEANRSYRLGASTMTDQAFDDLLESYCSDITKDEYEAFRAALSDPLGEVPHPYVMGSLEKLKAEEPEDVTKWITNHIDPSQSLLLVTAKIDGMSCRMKFNGDGELILAATRGDGSNGQDVTAQVLASECLKDVDLITTTRAHYDIRGELLIKDADLEALNSLEGVSFKNARNAVVGIMGRKEIDPKMLKYVSFIAYEIMGDHGWFRSNQMTQLAFWGFELPRGWTAEIEDDVNAQLINYYELAKEECDYLIDGLVICADDNVNEDRYLPKNMVAFKVNDLSAETRLLDIEWNLSKAGKMTPVGILEPVELGGATIGRVTCYNTRWVIENDLRYGVGVKIIRSGEVIPKVIEVHHDDTLNQIDLPTQCPSCGSELVMDGVDLKCPNHLECPDQIGLIVNQFIRRLDVENASIKTLRNFGINTFKDLLAWQPTPQKSQQALYNEFINKIFHASKYDLLRALPFDSIAGKTFDKIIAHYGFDNIVNDGLWLQSHMNTDLPDGVGEITIQKFISSLPRNLEILNMIVCDPRWEPTEDDPDDSEQPSGFLDGQSFCFTGKLNTTTRKLAGLMVTDAGGTVRSGVTKGLTYLVTNDATTGTTKNKKAKSLNVAIINEEDFLKIVNRVDETTIEDVMDL